MKGLIALDIDGTITSDFHSVPADVEHFFNELVNEGWQLCFITGRSYQFAKNALKNFTFPFYLAVINGATILEMPGEKVIASNGLDPTVIPVMNAICEDETTDFVIYGGFEQGDNCYYRPEHFSSDMLDYVLERAKVFNEHWVPISDFDALKFNQFSSIKCIAKKEVAERIAQKASAQLDIFMPVIRDPHQEGFFVAQGTRGDVNKGETVKFLRQLLGGAGPLIAAGDDHNDSQMLAAADICIIMESAPKEMHPLADILAKPASEQGIIEGLKEAIRSISWKG